MSGAVEIPQCRVCEGTAGPSVVLSVTARRVLEVNREMRNEEHIHSMVPLSTHVYPRHRVGRRHGDFLVGSGPGCVVECDNPQP